MQKTIEEKLLAAREAIELALVEIHHLKEVVTMYENFKSNIETRIIREVK